MTGPLSRLRGVDRIRLGQLARKAPNIGTAHAQARSKLVDEVF